MNCEEVRGESKLIDVSRLRKEESEWLYSEEVLQEMSRRFKQFQEKLQENRSKTVLESRNY